MCLCLCLCLCEVGCFCCGAFGRASVPADSSLSVAIGGCHNSRAYCASQHSLIQSLSEPHTLRDDSSVVLRRFLFGSHTAETLQLFISDSTAFCCVCGTAHPTVMYCPRIGTLCVAYLRKNAGELVLVEALILALKGSFAVVAVPALAAEADGHSSCFNAGSERCSVLRILVSGLDPRGGGMVSCRFIEQPQLCTVMQSWKALTGTLGEPRDVETVPSEELPREVRGKSTVDTDERISWLERQFEGLMSSLGSVRAPHAPSAAAAPGGPSAADSAAAEPRWSSKDIDSATKTFTLKHLQEVCRKKSLRVTGLKADVVLRITRVMTLDVLRSIELPSSPCSPGSGAASARNDPWKGAGSKEDVFCKGGPMC